MEGKGRSFVMVAAALALGMFAMVMLPCYAEIPEGESEVPMFACPQHTAYGQTPYLPGDSGWCAAISDIDSSVYRLDNFDVGSYPIEAVHWWGIGSCGDGTKSFVLMFYENNGGSPGALNATYTVTPTVTVVDGLYAGTDPGYHFVASLDTPCFLSSGWLCIYSASDPCSFSWLCSPNGDAIGYYGAGPSPVSSPLQTDMDNAFCLISSDVPIEGEGGGEGEEEGEGEEVNFLMTCLFPTEAGQEPFDSESAWETQMSEEGAAIVYDNFSVGRMPITGVRWWGLGDCTSPNDQFVVKIHEDAGGTPGEAVFDYTGPPSRVEATGEFFELAEAYVYTLLFEETPICLPTGWVSVYSPAGGCQFEWLGSENGMDGSSLAGLAPALNPLPFDMALCVVAGYEPCPDHNLECPNESLWLQAPFAPEDGGWCAAPSDADMGAYHYENFSGLSASIQEVSWWGTGSCDTGDKTFVIEFRADDQGQPGGLYSWYWITPSISPVDGLYGGTLPGARYTAQLSPPCPYRSGWISIYAADDPCEFDWLCSTGGDGLSYYGAGLNPMENLYSSDTNFAFCLAATGEDPAACPAETFFSQPIALPGDPLYGSRESDFARPSINMDNFSSLNGSIHGITWWGTGESGSKFPCGPMPESFWVKFYLDEQGQPGAIYDQYVVTPAVTEAFVQGITSSTRTVYRFDATLNIPCDLESGWIAIQALGQCCCFWGWSASSSGDSLSYHYEDYQQTAETMDFAFCFTPVETEGQAEGMTEGEGMVEGEEEGMIEGEEEGVTEGQTEGEGLEEGLIEGEEGEGAIEGEGQEEGLIEGEEGQAEGIIEGEGQLEGEGLTEGEGEDRCYTLDQACDHVITLSALLRVIQFFNSNGFHCQPGTEDGYAPGPGDVSCLIHDSDYNPQDWHISLSELLRVIQFFNFGGYHYCPEEGTEDGYCPGLA